MSFKQLFIHQYHNYFKEQYKNEKATFHGGFVGLKKFFT